MLVLCRWECRTVWGNPQNKQNYHIIRQFHKLYTQNLKAGSQRATRAATVLRHESQELERGAPLVSTDREEGRQNVARVHSGHLQPSQRLQHGAAFRTVG